MTVPPQAASCRRRLAALGVFLAMNACAAAPDLRPAGGPASPASLAEGKQLLEAGRAVEAMTAFRRVLRQEGADLQALNGLAIAYSELGKPGLAAEVFARALAIAPGDAATLNNIGFSALRRADAALARHYLRKARSRSGDLEEIEGNLARLAVLETMDRTRRSSTPGGWAAPAADRRSAQVIRLSLQNNGSLQNDGRRAISTEPEPKQPPRTSPTAMIDFTAVIDPFSGRKMAGHATNE